MIKTLISAKPISQFSFFSIKNSSLNPPRLLLHISHFTSFSPNTGGSSNNPTTSYPSRRHEEESRNVRVSVWWDFENCNLPTGVNVFRVAQSITAAIRANGIKGPIQITAFGDIMQISRQNQEALSSTGVNLTHIPNGGKNSADRSLLVDLMYWVSQNPPPAHLLLISGDRDFAGILHRLRMNNYNILLASTENAPSVLCSAASIMWRWNSLLKGENLSGKHFNQPPDGPYGSWYGHYKSPLEDPFAVIEQAAGPQALIAEQSTCPGAPVAEQLACIQSEDLSDSVSENKAQPIPKTVVKQIRYILYQYPKGISITELRAELSKSNLSIDKEFYGHKKFSKFLLAMPHILKLQSRNDGQFFVRGVTPKTPEQVDVTPKTPELVDLTPSSSLSRGPAQNGEVDSVVTAKVNGEKGSCSDQFHAKSSLTSSSARLLTNAGEPQNPSTTSQKPTGVLPELPSLEPKVKSPSIKLQEPRTEVQRPPKEVPEPPEVIQAGGNAKATESQHMAELSSVSEVGFFRRIWRKWFGKKDSGPEEKLANASDVILDDKMKAEGTDVKSRIESVKSVGTNSSSLTSDEKIPEDSPSRICVPRSEEMKTQGSDSFRQFLRKLFWGSSEHSDDSGEKFSEKVNQSKLAFDKSEIFGKESFWDELKAFLETPKASAIVMQSKTRMQIVQDLQKQGPPIFLTLNVADLLHLVELMISDKKWIEESHSQNYPFKLVHRDEKCSSTQFTSISRQPNGLSSIFSDTQPSSLSQRPRELDGQKRHQNPPHTGVSQPGIEGMPSGKSRSEILADCQKLLDAIVTKYPEGFNMGSFRKVFSERYGYHLDVQKLGYQKLATLLQIMPGVRIVSTYILPAGNLPNSLSLDSGVPYVQEISFGGTESNSESCISDASGKADDADSPWEELGPISNSRSKKNETSPAMNRRVKDETSEKLHHDYESLSDDYFSDSEEETSLSMKSESKKKPRINEEDSSLLQILDSWYGTKEDNIKRGASDNLERMADSSKNGSRVSSSAGSITKNEIPVMSTARKQRPLKNYSFVQDEAVENKDRLIDGILGSLKKSGERSAETRI